MKIKTFFASSGIKIRDLILFKNMGSGSYEKIYLVTIPTMGVIPVYLFAARECALGLFRDQLFFKPLIVILRFSAIPKPVSSTF